MISLLPLFTTFGTDLHSRHADGEARSRFLLALVDELEQPGDGAGDYAQALEGIIAADHGVGLACRRQTGKQKQGRDEQKKTRCLKEHDGKKKWVTCVCVCEEKEGACVSEMSQDGSISC